jgi:hypothetical protein
MSEVEVEEELIDGLDIATDGLNTVTDELDVEATTEN